jgi:hypothetical protein
MMHKRLIAITLTAGLLTASALAQQKGPNGGLLSGSGSHQIELISGPGELTVYLLENGKPHESSGTTLRAVIQDGGKTSTINFVDQGGKHLVAKLPAPLGKGAIVIVTGKDHHGDQLNARYVLN